MHPELAEGFKRLPPAHPVPMVMRFGDGTWSSSASDQHNGTGHRTALAVLPTPLTWGLTGTEVRLYHLLRPARRLRVLVGGQHAGATAHGDGSWTAQAHGFGSRSRPATTRQPSRWPPCCGHRGHAGSGARAASRVHWSERPTRLVARVSRAAPVAWAESGSRGTWLGLC